MAIKKLKIDPCALELKSVKDQIRDLEKIASGLRADLLSRYEAGVYPGFVIIEKSRSTLDQELLTEKLGNLEPFKKIGTAIYIEFPRTAS